MSDNCPLSDQEKAEAVKWMSWDDFIEQLNDYVDEDAGEGINRLIAAAYAKGLHAGKENSISAPSSGRLAGLQEAETIYRMTMAEDRRHEFLDELLDAIDHAEDQPSKNPIAEAVETLLFYADHKSYTLDKVNKVFPALEVDRGQKARDFLHKYKLGGYDSGDIAGAIKAIAAIGDLFPGVDDIDAHVAEMRSEDGHEFPAVPLSHGTHRRRARASKTIDIRIGVLVGSSGSAFPVILEGDEPIDVQMQFAYDFVEDLHTRIVVVCATIPLPEATQVDGVVGEQETERE